MKQVWCLQTSLVVFFGDSGSAIVNDHNHIVGVLTGSNNESEFPKSTSALDRDEVLTFLAGFDLKPEEVIAAEQ